MNAIELADKIQSAILQMADGAAIGYKAAGKYNYQARKFSINVEGVGFQIDFEVDRIIDE
jgi:hypothetical protein